MAPSSRLVGRAPERGEALEGGPFPHRLSPCQGDGRGGPRFVHEPSGMLFPKRLEGYALGPIHRYDRAGLDVSGRYATAGTAWVSVYVFPAGGGRLVDAFESSVADMLRAFDAPPASSERRTVGVLTRGGERREGLRIIVIARRSLQGIDDSWRSIVDVYRIGDFFLKFRASFPARLAAAFAEPSARFIAAWHAPEDWD